MCSVKIKPDWDPRAEEVVRDQRAFYDKMRESRPVAYSEFLHWSVFRHADVVRILEDPDTFSNAVSKHLSVPNGMDGEEHRTYRNIIDAYFTPDRMAPFEGIFRALTNELLTTVLAVEETEIMGEFAQPFAGRVQCAFLGWPQELAPKLVHWTLQNQAATIAQDRSTLAQMAAELQTMIDEVLATRRAKGAQAEQDITASLMHEVAYGRKLNNQEIASILRNWTVGEIGTIAASIGIIVHFLAEHPDIQAELRAKPELLTAANDEILRIDGPLATSRRITTKPVAIGGRQIGEGERITIMWISANRDPGVFPEPDTFRLDRDPSLNLLFGRGVHDCPGAPLARLQMRVVMEELLRRTERIELVEERPAVRAIYPAAGFSKVFVRFS